MQAVHSSEVVIPGQRLAADPPLTEAEMAAEYLLRAYDAQAAAVPQVRPSSIPVPGEMAAAIEYLETDFERAAAVLVALRRARDAVRGSVSSPWMNDFINELTTVELWVTRAASTPEDHELFVPAESVAAAVAAVTPTRPVRKWGSRELRATLSAALAAARPSALALRKTT